MFHFVLIQTSTRWRSRFHTIQIKIWKYSRSACSVKELNVDKDGDLKEVVQTETTITVE